MSAFGIVLDKTALCLFFSVNQVVIYAVRQPSCLHVTELVQTCNCAFGSYMHSVRIVFMCIFFRDVVAVCISGKFFSYSAQKIWLQCNRDLVERRGNIVRSRVKTWGAIKYQGR